MNQQEKRLTECRDQEKDLSGCQHRETETSQIEKDCLVYFRSNPVWKRLLRGFWEKYRSYGAFSGSVILRGLAEDEVGELEGFFAKSFHGKKSVSISATRFSDALADSRFAQVLPERLLTLYFGREPIAKRMEQQIRDQAREKIVADLMDMYRGTVAETLFPELLDVVNSVRTASDEEWKAHLILGAEILNHLPYRSDETLYLAVFATRMTGNPHAFDPNCPQGRFVYQLIQKELAVRGCLPHRSELFPAFYRKKCFLNVGILLDDVSNYTMLSCVRAQKKDGGYHAGLDGFLAENDMVQVSLSVLNQLERIIGMDHRIYIVENPSVFAEICGDSQKNRSCMCMNGQPRLAGLVALELLAAAGTSVYYAGDFDPEGLLIAQKLAYYYRDTLHGTFYYWHFTPADYRMSCSGEIISAKRLKMLDHITDAELLPVVQLMRETGLAGYQEKIEWSESVQTEAFAAENVRI